MGGLGGGYGMGGMGSMGGVYGGMGMGGYGYGGISIEDLEPIINTYI